MMQPVTEAPEDALPVPEIKKGLCSRSVRRGSCRGRDLSAD